MKPLRLAVALLVSFGFVGCGSDQAAEKPDVVMPDVVGQQLDVALSDIERAGFTDDVEVIGGGTFGVVDESNWQVCDQLPSAGQALTAAPRLTVDRSCDEAAAESEETEPGPTTTEAAAAPETTTTEPVAEPETTTTAPVTEDVLTVESSVDLAALLVEPDNCSDTIAAFAAKYRGRTIEFDGNIALMGSHGDSVTRYDILVSPGDYSETSAIGPTFQFRDVGIFDLQLTGPNIPDYVGQGDNLHVLAQVGNYEVDTCLFLLKPISTEVR